MVNFKSKNSPPKSKIKNRVKLIIILFIVILFILLMASFILVIINRKNQNVYDNVYIGKNNIGRISQTELYNMLIQKNSELTENLSIDIYQENDKIYTVSANDIDFRIDIERTIHSIMTFGRTGSVIVDNINIINAKIFKKYFEIQYLYDEDKLKDVIFNIDLSIKNRYRDYSYSIDEENRKLYITKGITGNSIDYEYEKNSIIDYFSGKLENVYKLNIKEKKPDILDVDKMYESIKVEAANAYVDNTKVPEKYISEKVGIDVDIEKIKSDMQNISDKEEGFTFEYSLIITEPEVKLEDITYKLCKDKLGGLTTYFDANNLAKSNNLEIALRYMDGKIIMPGEIFSYNDCIGDTTAAKGYVESGTYKGGNVVMEIGGGICQSVSTLYNAVLLADLEIVERHQHSLPVNYVGLSLDATVYSPIIDFKFKNTRSYPVKIVTLFSSNGTINVSIYGTKEKEEYDISLKSEYISKIEYTTKYVYDNTLNYGEQIVLTEGVDGYKSKAYIIKEMDGKEISEELLSTDIYSPQQKVVKIGTKK